MNALDGPGTAAHVITSLLDACNESALVNLRKDQRTVGRDFLRGLARGEYGVSCIARL
jgi:hypothetical protein